MEFGLGAHNWNPAVLQAGPRVGIGTAGAVRESGGNHEKLQNDQMIAAIGGDALHGLSVSVAEG